MHLAEIRKTFNIPVRPWPRAVYIIAIIRCATDYSKRGLCAAPLPGLLLSLHNPSTCQGQCTCMPRRPIQGRSMVNAAR